MTETDMEQAYLKALPLLAEWKPEQRAQFIAGMERLQSMNLRGPMEEWIGVIMVLSTGHVEASNFPRSVIAESTNREPVNFSLHPETCAALREPPNPGEFDVLVLAPWGEFLIGVPAMRRYVEPEEKSN